jgi:hypothetical protein
LLKDLPSLLTTTTFATPVIVALQNSVDEDGNVVEVDTSACIVASDAYWTQQESMDAAMLIEVYKSAREEKGEGEGTDFGFTMSNFATYQSLLVAGFDMYSQCNLDYYLVAIGSNTQSVSGLSNLGMNLYYRLTAEDDTTLSDVGTALVNYATTADDTNLAALGTASGSLLRAIL